MKKINILERAKSLEILLYLYHNENKNPGLLDIRTGTGASSGSIQMRLFELGTIGLIQEKTRSGITTKREVKLTPKGKKIAKLVDEINKTLEEE